MKKGIGYHPKESRKSESSCHGSGMGFLQLERQISWMRGEAYTFTAASVGEVQRALG